MVPQIYVACLASYNAGRLHGKWIEVSDVDTMHDEIAEMLEASPEPNAEDWAIHDVEDVPNLGENPALGDVCAVVDLLNELGEDAAEIAIACLCPSELVSIANDPHHEGLQIDVYDDEGEALDAFGAFDDVPDHIAPYIDEKALFRDYFMDANTGRHNGSIFVLRYN